MQMKLELVPIPVADVDRAKTFYVEPLGFVEDVDVKPGCGRPGRAADASRLALLDRHGH
jgi:catechol 2,3-dioxygenase-like lactoylglutathione lyase family enzyme